MSSLSQSRKFFQVFYYSDKRKGWKCGIDRCTEITVTIFVPKYLLGTLSFQFNITFWLQSLSNFSTPFPKKSLDKNDHNHLTFFCPQTYLPNVSSEGKVLLFCHDVSQFRFQVVTLLAIFVTVNANFGFAINFAHLESIGNKIHERYRRCVIEVQNSVFFNES